jgi:hypothetical protein
MSTTQCRRDKCSKCSTFHVNMREIIPGMAEDKPFLPRDLLHATTITGSGNYEASDSLQHTLDNRVSTSTVDPRRLPTRTNIKSVKRAGSK